MFSLVWQDISFNYVPCGQITSSLSLNGLAAFLLLQLLYYDSTTVYLYQYILFWYMRYPPLGMGRGMENYQGKDMKDYKNFERKKGQEFWKEERTNLGVWED